MLANDTDLRVYRGVPVSLEGEDEGTVSKALEKSSTPMSTRCLCSKDSNRSCTVNISWVSQENPERNPCRFTLSKLFVCKWAIT